MVIIVTGKNKARKGDRVLEWEERLLRNKRYLDKYLKEKRG